MNETDDLGLLSIDHPATDRLIGTFRQLKQDVVAVRGRRWQEKPLARTLDHTPCHCPDVGALLPLANQELDIGQVIVSIHLEVVDPFRRDDQAAVVAAELTDDPTVDAILVPG